MQYFFIAEHTRTIDKSTNLYPVQYTEKQSRVIEYTYKMVREKSYQI